MPSFDEKFNQALTEELSNPSFSTRQIVDTLEFYHSAFNQPVYVYNGDQFGVADPSGTGITSRMYGIESEAVRNAGQEVEFVACPMELVLPEQGENKRGTFKIKVSGASALLYDHVQAASASNEPVQCIFRRYLSDMPEEPSQIDITTSILSASIQGVTVEVEGKYFEFFDYSFGLIYTRDKFKQLVGV